MGFFIYLFDYNMHPSRSCQEFGNRRLHKCVTKIYQSQTKTEEFYSDCKTNFKGAAKELKEKFKNINQTRIGEFCRNNKINWHFNPPTPCVGTHRRFLGKASMKHIIKDLFKGISNNHVRDGNS